MILFEIIGAPFTLRHKFAIKNWIKEIILSENYKMGDINIILADDEYVLEINKTYLSHDYYTDIITFDTSGYGVGDRQTSRISADIFISLDTVKANAAEYGTDFTTELYRVMAHGILHLTGHDDLTDEQKADMRNAEDIALSLLPELLLEQKQEY